MESDAWPPWLIRCSALAAGAVGVNVGQIDVKCGAGVVANDPLLLPELSLGRLKLQPKNFDLTLKARGHLFGLADLHLQGARVAATA
jgi:hypothetical protein